MFTWVPFFREVADNVLHYEDRQHELLALLREMQARGLKTISLDDDGAALAEIDPFTFFANFNRGDEANRRAILQFLQQQWRLSAALPDDLEGVPTIHVGPAWFFSPRHARQPGDIAALWQIARAAFEGTSATLDGALFERCLQIKQVGLGKLTMGLFWLNPENFVALDGPTIRSLRARGIEWDDKALRDGDVTVYRQLVEAVRTVPEAVTAATSRLELPSSALNQILYGPPGTGKTFTALRRAVEIIDGAAPADDAAWQARFDDLRRAGRIGVVTFHQSFSYEEFIEGIRPRLDEADEGQMRYGCHDGLLKTLALRALGACLEAREPGRATFEAVWSALLEQIEATPEERYQGLTAHSKFTLEVSSQGNVKGQNLTSRAIYYCPHAKAEAAWEALRDVPRVNSSQVWHAVGGANSHLIAVVVNELKHLEKTLSALPSAPFDPIHAAKSYLGGQSGYRLQGCAGPRFVLVIDEINRGNVSQILGELITLLDEDKRLGAANGLTVTLPYSGEPLALPTNLYVLGTMNTADKSLALLDVALRRRFEFEELPPDFGLCPYLTAAMRQALEELNRRLTLGRDREHRIGHAYFMNVASEADFNRIFGRKIIPLLQEFFYNDWDGLRFALGESGESGRFIRPLPDVGAGGARTRWQWWFDVPGERLSCLDRLLRNYAGQ